MLSLAESRTDVEVPWRKVLPWLPLLVLPLAVGWIAAGWPQWLLMWSLTFSIYAGAKWLSFTADSIPSETTLKRCLGYLLMWPGMDAKSFLASRPSVDRPSRAEWLCAIIKTSFGLVFVAAAVPLVYHYPLACVWIGMTGIVFTLHFGSFHLLSLAWRRMGIIAPPIMNAPILASSLSDFWGRRWNLAFRDMAHRHIFRPLVGKLGITGATMAVFFVSGIVHDVAISVSARRGFGLPTLYFLLQGVGMLFERSGTGRRMGIGAGPLGRLFCAAVVLGPVMLLFHPPFIEQVVVPMFEAMGRV
ncbi:MAG: wax synthase family protein [Pirellulaceae bacterium]